MQPSVVRIATGWFSFSVPPFSYVASSKFVRYTNKKGVVEYILRQYCLQGEKFK